MDAVPPTAPLPVAVPAAERLVPRTAPSPQLVRLTELAARLLSRGDDQVAVQVSLLGTVQTVAAAANGGPPAGSTCALADSLCTVTAAGGAPLVVADAPRDARVAHLPPVQTGQVGSYLGVPLVDDRDLLVGALCAFAQQPRSWTEQDVRLLEDLAVAVLARLELDALTGEYVASRLRWDVAIAAAGIGSFDWDLDSGRLDWDERMQALFGYEPGQFVPGDTAALDRVHPLDRTAVEAAVAAALHRGDFQAEFRVQVPGGAERWVAARGQAVPGRQGEPTRLVGSAYDITARRLDQERAELAAQRLALLASVSASLAESGLDAEDAVAGLARTLVPDLADWCIVSLLDDEGVLRDVAGWHVAADLRPHVQTLLAERTRDRTEPGLVPQVQRTGRPVLIPGQLARTVRPLLNPKAAAAFDALAGESAALAPLHSRSGVIGVVTAVRGADRSPFGPDELAVLEEIAARAGTALESARLYARQHHVAEELQRSLMTRPPEPDHCEIVVRYVPAAEAASVGGDWFDSFLQPDGATVLVIGDVMGHDSVAAAAMGQVRNLLRGIAWHSGGGPADVLAGLDAAMQGLEVGTTASAVVARLEQTDDEQRRGVTRLRWSNAGHPPPVAVNPDGSVLPLLRQEVDLLLGIDPTRPRGESVVALDRGSTVLLYTDGLVERRGQDLDEGIGRLQAALADLADRPLQVLCDDLLARLLAAEPEDDVALVAVRLHRQDRPRPAEAGPEHVPDGVD